jgi:hypothetical protein
MENPYRVNIRIPLIDIDERFFKIQELIDIKRQMLLDKQKKIKLISKQNCFLDTIKNDYMKYYTFIHQQKQDQIRALELLNNYIKDLTVSGKLSKHNIEDAKIEQKKILKELKSIKKGLDSIIDDTNEISNNDNKI